MTRPAAGLILRAWQSAALPEGFGRPRETGGVAVGEDAGTIEEVNEPFLIMQGFIKRTPRGREALPSAYEKIGATPKRRTSNHPELPI